MNKRENPFFVDEDLVYSDSHPEEEIDVTVCIASLCREGIIVGASH